MTRLTLVAPAIFLCLCIFLPHELHAGDSHKNEASDSTRPQFAARLLSDGKYSQAIRIFEAALADSDPEAKSWEFHCGYATCLSAAAFESTNRFGVAGPQQSISSERIDLVRQAIRELDIAEGLTSAGPIVAMLRVQRGTILETWGFPLDAYGCYRSALGAAPFDGDASAGLARMRALLGSSE